MWIFLFECIEDSVCECAIEIARGRFLLRTKLRRRVAAGEDQRKHAIHETRVLIHFCNVLVEGQVTASNAGWRTRSIYQNREEAIQRVLASLACRLEPARQIQSIKVARSLIVVSDRRVHVRDGLELLRRPCSRCDRLAPSGLAARRAARSSPFKLAQQSSRLFVIAFIDKDAKQ